MEEWSLLPLGWSGRPPTLGHMGQEVLLHLSLEKYPTCGVCFNFIFCFWLENGNKTDLCILTFYPTTLINSVINWISLFLLLDFLHIGSYHLKNKVIFFLISVVFTSCLLIALAETSCGMMNRMMGIFFVLFLISEETFWVFHNEVWYLTQVVCSDY